MNTDVSDMIDISVEVEALNLDGIKQNLLDYVEKEAKIDIDKSVENADKSAQDAKDCADEASASATLASDCATQASESLGNYYTKTQTDSLLSAKQNTLTFDSIPTSASTNPITSGGVYTALTDKASTSLDNLSASGQMIIDSQNGTISNCILEIPQNLKLELSNNTLTLKAGSILTKTGSTYVTLTTTEDRTVSYSSDGTFIQFASGTTGQMVYRTKDINTVGSGSSLPVDGSTYTTFFNTTDKTVYNWSSDAWAAQDFTYPLCVIKVESGVASFAKDSNGNDMIFNGAGFIGHHAFVYPNVKALIPDGFNDDGTLKSTPVTINSLYITELSNKASIYDYTVGLSPYSTQVNKYYIDKVKSLSEVTVAWLRYFVEDKNGYYYDNTTAINYTGYVPLISYIYDGTTVTDFTIRQPVRTATVEMLNSALGDIETLLATV